MLLKEKLEELPKHIAGAYKVNIKGVERLHFRYTRTCEAFTAMRAREHHKLDIAILIVRSR